MTDTPRLKVWIDQDLCTGDGICTDHAPEVFRILEDGIAYCLDGPKVFNDPGGPPNSPSCRWTWRPR